MTLGEQLRIVLLAIVCGLAGIAVGVVKLKDLYGGDVPFTATIPYGLGGMVIGAVLATLFIIASRRKPKDAA